MHTLLCSASVRLCAGAAAALLLLALSLLRSSAPPDDASAAFTTMRTLRHLQAAAAAVGTETADGVFATGANGRVDVLIPYSPGDRAVFLTDDPSKGALASVLRHVSDLRTVFIVANAASQPELEPVLQNRRVVFVDEDSVLPKADLSGWHYQQV